jgi:PIN domain nuclease of toxin-antitoxin system
MKLLLDTHVLLWSATAPHRLAPETRAALEDGTHDALVSIVSAWEIAIKQSIGKLELARPAEQWLSEC